MKEKWEKTLDSCIYMRYNPNIKFNGDERDEYPAFSTREARSAAESRAQKPRGRKEHS